MLEASKYAVFCVAKRVNKAKSEKNHIENQTNWETFDVTTYVNLPENIPKSLEDSYLSLINVRTPILSVSSRPLLLFADAFTRK